MVTRTAGQILSGGGYKRTYTGATAAFGAFNDLLKIFYEDPMADLVNNTRILTRMLNREVPGISVSGRTVTCNVRTGTNESRKATREGAILPAAGNQTTRQVQWTTQSVYGRTQFTGQYISAARNNRGSFLSAMDLELNGMAGDVQHGEQRACVGDGTGRLCRVVSASHAAGVVTVTVEHPGGIASQALGTQYLRVGMRVCFVITGSEGTAVGGLTNTDFRADGSGTPIYSWEITGVDYTNGTFTIASDATLAGAIAANDYVYTARDAGITGIRDADCDRGIEMNGLASVVSANDPPLQRPGTDPTPRAGYGDLAVATEPLWQASVIANSVPTPIDEQMLQTLQDHMEMNGNGFPELFFTTHGIRRSFVFQLIQQRRRPASGKVPEYMGGFRAVLYNGIPLVVDKDATRGRVYGLDLSTMSIAKENDWNWLDDAGLVLRWIEDHDAFQVIMRRYAELACKERNRNGVITNVQDA